LNIRVRAANFFKEQDKTAMKFTSLLSMITTICTEGRPNRRLVLNVGSVFLLALMVGFYLQNSLVPVQVVRTNIKQSSLYENVQHGTSMLATLVERNDYIYRSGAWDGPPVVIEEFKLIFFTIPKVGCSVWKMLFRRMMHYENWKSDHFKLPGIAGTLITGDKHNPRTNGLRYLSDYDLETASTMMTSPEWTRAIFVRDPKERFVSAFLEKAVRRPGFVFIQCCKHRLGLCLPIRDVILAQSSAQIFFSRIVSKCEDSHWMRQSKRMEDKYWPYINFVGHMETVEQDAERLLRKIGAWEKYGATGWGQENVTNHSSKQSSSSNKNSTSSDVLPVVDLDYIFAPSQTMARSHASGASSKVKDIITSFDFEKDIETYYESDYRHAVLNITLR
jgi:Sulfotransferase family